MKKSSSNIIPIDLAFSESKWINTPFLYAKLGSTFSRLQQTLMFRVCSSLQDYIAKAITAKCSPTPQSTPSHLSFDDIPTINIPFSDLSVSESHYEVFNDNFLQDFKDLWIEVPDIDSTTGRRLGNIFLPVFDYIYVPTFSTKGDGTAYLYKYNSDDPNRQPVRKAGHISLHINKTVAQFIFDISQGGYVNHLEKIATNASTVYTARLYVLLMKHFGMNKHNPSIDLVSLKDWLGMYERNPKSSEIIREKHEKFYHFKKFVLDTAMNDLDRLGKENKSDITFSYEPVYEPGKTRGNPKAVKFHIKRTPLGDLREIEKHHTSLVNDFVRTMSNKWGGIDPSEIQTIASKIPTNLWSSFQNFCYKDIERMVEAPHRWGGTLDSYVLWLMKKWNQQTSPEDATTLPPLLSPSTPQTPSQPTPPSTAQPSPQPTPQSTPQSSAPSTPQSSAPSSPPSPSQPIDSSSDAHLSALWPEILASLPGNPICEALASATYTGLSMGYFSVRFPSRESLNSFNDMWESKSYAPHVTALKQRIFDRTKSYGMSIIIKRSF